MVYVHSFLGRQMLPQRKMGRALRRKSCSPGWRLHNFPRAEEQLCPQLLTRCFSVVLWRQSQPQDPKCSSTGLARARHRVLL